MAGPYQRLSNGQSADSGAQAITTVVNAVEAGLEDAEAAIATKAAASHTHAEADVTGLTSALAGKASSSHSHSGSDITSGTVPIARIPTGTSSTTVSLGNHTHTVSGSDGYSRVYVEDYGAVADGGASWVLTTSAASTTVSVTGYTYYSDVTFKASDVGKTIRLSRADFSGSMVSRTITAVAGDGKSCTISSAPGFTSTNVWADWGGTDNASAIQAAFNDAKGRTVVFGPGVYLVGSKLTIPNGLKVEGRGWPSVPMTADNSLSYQHADGTTIALRRGVDAHLLSMDGAAIANVVISGMRLIGSTESGTTKYTIDLTYSGSYIPSHFELNNLYVLGGQHNLKTLVTGQVLVHGGNWGISRGHSVYLGSSDNGLTDLSVFSDLDGAAGRASVYMASGQGNNVINGGYFQWGAYGIIIDGVGNTVTGARVDTSGDTGIQINGTGNTVVGNSVVGIAGQTQGYAVGNKYGIHITGNKNTVMGNTTWDPNSQMAKGTALTGTADGNVVIPGASTAAHLNTASGTNVVITS